MNASAKDIPSHDEQVGNTDLNKSVTMSDGDDIAVEVIGIDDDTPPADRGKKPLPKDILDEIENDGLEGYSEKVQQRMKQLKKVYHDERRAKEEADRQRVEAVKFAEGQVAENRKLRQQLGHGEKLFVGEVGKSAQMELSKAKQDLHAALEKGDSAEITEAQEALTDAKLRIQKVKDYQPSLQPDDDDVQDNSRTQRPVQRQAPPPDDKAVEWKKQNAWFGSDEAMTAFALGLHQKLVNSGMDVQSDEYYDRINAETRRRFPEAFDDAEENDTARNKPEPRKQPKSIVAPATRSSAPRQVRLTQSQLALAKKFGLTPEQYARELVKLEQNNG